MSILDNELVKKYFGCPSHNHNGGCVFGWYCGSKEAMALRILKAMEEPIKEGEEYIYIKGDRIDSPEFAVEKAFNNFMHFHPWFLRLPSQFQPKKECSCTCGSVSHTSQPPKPDPVEEKIKRITELTTCGNRCCDVPVNWTRENELRELVELVRHERT